MAHNHDNSRVNGQGDKRKRPGKNQRDGGPRRDANNMLCDYCQEEGHKIAACPRRKGDEDAKREQEKLAKEEEALQRLHSTSVRMLTSASSYSDQLGVVSTLSRIPGGLEYLEENRPQLEHECQVVKTTCLRSALQKSARERQHKIIEELSNQYVEPEDFDPYCPLDIGHVGSSNRAFATRLSNGAAGRTASRAVGIFAWAFGLNKVSRIHSTQVPELFERDATGNFTNEWYLCERSYFPPFAMLGPHQPVVGSVGGVPMSNDYDVENAVEPGPGCFVDVNRGIVHYPIGSVEELAAILQATETSTREYSLVSHRGFRIPTSAFHFPGRDRSETQRGGMTKYTLHLVGMTIACFVFIPYALGRGILLCLTPKTRSVGLRPALDVKKPDRSVRGCMGFRRVLYMLAGLVFAIVIMLFAIGTQRLNLLTHVP